MEINTITASDFETHVGSSTEEQYCQYLIETTVHAMGMSFQIAWKEQDISWLVWFCISFQL
ncbi:MAG: hypothetical protein CL912_09495 [Deltaproteobacteria bacterium]|nr:hypothetical protein [Deltaproteobacteria bacterium]